MEQLIDYANHENQNIQKAALECIRNLCIDKQACLDIMELGYNQLIENLVQSKHITQTFQIIRNIWIQQKPCFFGFFNEPSFVDSLLSVLRSDDPDAQKASLDLVEYLINAKNEKYTTLLIQSNVIMSLRHLLLSTHKQKAAALFARVNLKDPWQTIEQGWRHKDKRRPKPMKPKSKKKSIY
jgi:hypothetical protein